MPRKNVRIFGGGVAMLCVDLFRICVEERTSGDIRGEERTDNLSKRFNQYVESRAKFVLHRFSPQ